MAVDSNGLPHARCVTTADISDREGALEMIKRYAPHLTDVIKVLADGAYTGAPFATAVASLLGAVVEIAKRSELHKFAVIPKRWVVERTFAWLDKCRRLWKCCERSAFNYLQMTSVSLISLILRRY